MKSLKIRNPVRAWLSPMTGFTQANKSPLPMCIGVDGNLSAINKIIKPFVIKNKKA